MSEAYLNIKELNVYFNNKEGQVTALNAINLSLNKGEVLGLIGESGSGKSLLLKTMLQLLPKQRTSVSGEIHVNGRNVLTLNKKALRAYRGGEVAMAFQEPATAMDPVFTVGNQIINTIMAHKKCTKTEAKEKAVEMLELVKIPSARSRLNNYPHELSGGMRQRVMIALALSTEPALLLADEPTTALDATVQIQVILLLRELQKKLGMSMIFVTHDVGVAAEVSDNIAVMYGGRLLEYGSAQNVLVSPRHPYTEALLASNVQNIEPGARIDTIPGMPPDLANLPSGCVFAPRCKYSEAACLEKQPTLKAISEGSLVACIKVNEDVLNEQV